MCGTAHRTCQHRHVLEENAIEGVCHSCEGFTPSQFDEWYDADMIEFAQQYALFSMGTLYQRELKSTPDAVLMIEKKIDASMYGKGHGGHDGCRNRERQGAVHLRLLARPRCQGRG